MSKKVLILSGSPRKNGNSDYLCGKFKEGALKKSLEDGKIDKNFQVKTSEEDFLHAIYAYINTLEDISAQFIEIMSKIIIEEKNRY